MYPNDDQFQETTVAKVRDEGNGWSIKRADGWTFYVPAPTPLVPAVGMLARFYGKGLGFQVRGLFLDGQEVFYRTEAEDKAKREIDAYGADAADWLKRWDAGSTCWSISMSGFGPSYEQAIQIAMTEILRHLLERQYDLTRWGDLEAKGCDVKEIEAAGSANARISALGLSGAQWGAAMNLAFQLYRHGPRDVMADERVKYRHIQVQRTFPAMPD